MSLKRVHIRGGGIAAWTCARLLSGRGFEVTVERPGVRKLPWILVNPPTERLLCEFSGNPGLFHDAPRVRRRTVLWGLNAEPVTVDHSAAVIAEEALLDRLWGCCGAGVQTPALTGGAVRQGGSRAFDDVIAAPPAPSGQHHFGTRTAFIARVALCGARESCWIESLAQGWLFLIAGADSEGSLIAVGDRPEALLKSSRCVAPQVKALHEVSAEAPAYPRIASPLSGDGWIACGTAAMALDPLCGDGSGHAVREAILTAAVLGGISKGLNRAELLEHYESRMAMTFERHLHLCRSFYATAQMGPWWQNELAMLDRGIEWSRARAPQRWRYRLDGFDLVSI